MSAAAAHDASACHWPTEQAKAFCAHLPETQTSCCKTSELAGISDHGRLDGGSKLVGKMGLERNLQQSCVPESSPAQAELHWWLYTGTAWA